MRLIVPLVIFSLAMLPSYAEASVVVISGPSPIVTPIETDDSNLQNAHFHIASKGLYRPSGSPPYDTYGLAHASVSVDLMASLDLPLTPLNYQGKDSMYAELSGYIRLIGRRDSPHNLDFPIHAAVVFSPTDVGTDVFVKPIARSGDLPLNSDHLLHFFGVGLDEMGEPIVGATFFAGGAKSTYAFDYQNVVDRGTLRVLPEITSTQRYSSFALALERLIVGSQSYLTDRPYEQRELYVYYSSVSVTSVL